MLLKNAKQTSSTTSPSSRYFWTETWADRIGPYATEAEAEEAAKLYAEQL